MATVKHKRETKLQELLGHDKALLNPDDNTIIIGVDEVGRGSCIGPVTAAAFCFTVKDIPYYEEHCLYLDDSKKVSAIQRQNLYEFLCQLNTYAIGEASQQEVEQFNVYQAALLSARRAVMGVCYKLGLAENLTDTLPENVLVLLDGKAVIKEFPRQQQLAIVKGDGKSFSIAAASVIAKHYRDQYVIQLAKDFPGYQWDSNMGYPTPAHKKAIASLGPTPHHRKTYKTVSQLNLPI